MDQTLVTIWQHKYIQIWICLWTREMLFCLELSKMLIMRKFTSICEIMSVLSPFLFLSSVLCECEMSFNSCVFSVPPLQLLFHTSILTLTPFFLSYSFLFTSRQTGWHQEGCHVTAQSIQLILLSFSVSLWTYSGLDVCTGVAAGELMVLVFEFKLDWSTHSMLILDFTPANGRQGVKRVQTVQQCEARHLPKDQ